MKRHSRHKIGKTFPSCLGGSKWLSAFCLQPRFSALLPQSARVAGRVGARFITLGNGFGLDLASQKPSRILWAKHVAVPKRGSRGATIAATVSFSQCCPGRNGLTSSAPVV